jgi:hypothetical protein
MHHCRCTRSFSFTRKCSSMTGRIKRTSSASALPSSDRRRPAHTGLLVRLIRALRDWVRRPVGIYKLDGRWRAGLVERRRAPADAWAFRVLLDDLQERLLTQEPGMADALLGQLIQVHDEGRQKGWAGVLALPPAVRSRALFQAQLLAEQAPHPSLAQLIERLRQSQPVADGAARPPSLSSQRSPVCADLALEVTETSPEAFEAEAQQMGWLDTVSPLQPREPAPLAPPAPAPSPAPPAPSR